MGVSYYDIFGIDQKATSDEIRQAYFRMAREYHPDTNSSISGREFFLRIQEAYETLSNTKKRIEYDLLLKTAAKSERSINSIIKLSSASIPLLKDPQLVYALMELEPIDVGNKQLDNQVHLCFVIDRSTSMKGSRIEMVKSFILKAIAKLNPQDLISIVVFNDNADVLLTPTKVSDLRMVDKKIFGINTSGGTEIYKGLKSSIELLWEGKRKDLLRHLFLFTDGHTYGDETPSLQLAKVAAEQGIVINAFGIGHEWNDQFIDELANATGGKSIFVYRNEDLYDYLDEFLNSTRNVFARKVMVSYVSDPKVKLQYIFKIQPDIAELPITSPVVVGDLYQKHKTSILFAFEIDPLDQVEQEVMLINGLIQMNLNNQNEYLSEEILRIIVQSKSSIVKEQPPLEILNALSKITLYQMQQRARQDVINGEYKKAVKRLGYMATKVIIQGNQPFANLLLEEAGRIRMNNSFSEDGDKRIKYGTRALLQLPEPKKRPE